MQPPAQSNRESPAGTQAAPTKARRWWPFVALAAVVLFMALNVYWMSREVGRIRRYKASFRQTNAVSPAPGTPTR